MPNNPFAFPQPIVERDGMITASAEYRDAGGMELRDYFAGQVLVGIINQSTIPEVAQMIMALAATRQVGEHDVMAISAYRYADAMLAAREKGGA